MKLLKLLYDLCGKFNFDPMGDLKKARIAAITILAFAAIITWIFKHPIITIAIIVIILGILGFMAYMTYRDANISEYEKWKKRKE